ncbi:MAG TPA: alpha/beta hydrolase fold domain-containing protein [Terriglobales bacterium]|jgi:acetyl esterase/lipase
MKSAYLGGLLSLLLAASPAWAQTTAATAAQKDSSFIDAQGTAHVTRVVPLPASLSPQAQAFLARPRSDAAGDQSLAARRQGLAAGQQRDIERFNTMYPATVADATIAGVPVRVVTPPNIPAAKKAHVLINLHGGGFNADSGSVSETMPMSSLTQTQVIAVLYRLAPEHPFPAAVDDAVAVYRAELKTHRPQDIALYGTSAGAILTGEVAVKLERLGLPLPAALGIFSGFGDFSRHGDSQAIFALNGLSGHLDPPAPGADSPEYVGKTDPRDPVLSPVFADLHGLPPTLFITSERDMLLSGTTILHRAFLNAGDDARLIVFEGLPHAFWNDINLPESKEADQDMANFFDRYVGAR